MSSSSFIFASSTTTSAIHHLSSPMSPRPHKDRPLPADNAALLHPAFANDKDVAIPFLDLWRYKPAHEALAVSCLLALYAGGLMGWAITWWIL